jgi:selenide,water dikinase
MGPGDLTKLLPKGEQLSGIDVLIPPGDDAGAYALTPDLAIVQTADFITPVLDDPYLYGQIAAANSLSDCFATGAEVRTALALVMYDNCHVPIEALEAILKGGADKVKECGGVLLGGHTINDIEMKYGLSVTGTCHPEKLWRNQGAQIGDALILTKPLGMGVLSTAIKVDKAEEATITACAAVMSRLNLYAMRAARNFEVHACTDVTGFGLLGHLLEMHRSEISFELKWAKIPYIKEAIEAAKNGLIPGGSLRNRDYTSSAVHFATTLTEEESILLYDAQTSGGLLLAVRGDQAGACLEAIREAGDTSAAIVGRVMASGVNKITVG